MLIKKRVTIKEVALAAGVSTQTVSRVLNDRPDVSAETRDKIRQIIAELGYSPNVLARSLIQGRSHTLGVVGYGLGYYGPSRVITGVERRANELGFSLLLSLVREPETNDGETILHHLVGRQVDGIIWAVPEIGENRDRLVEQMHRLSVPVVFINMQSRPGVAVAAIDNCLGGRLAASHLIEQNCRKIGLIAGPSSWWEARQREQGWREVMQEHGLLDEAQLAARKVTGDWYHASGAAGLAELLRRSPDLEAVFASNDAMAAGALQAARKLGRRVPQDLAIVGFDDAPEAAFYYPSLTTIQQPLVDLGGQAVDLLNRILEAGSGDDEIGTSGQIESSLAVSMPPKIVVRESSIRA
ncbi:MAG TPA: LacI family DNA-binding transcriptional regulator [Anaerolineaceae bacterium]|nr:LacI family DNA-binding transcriptional regulator [Anaerolineaceae bacterium]